MTKHTQTTLILSAIGDVFLLTVGISGLWLGAGVVIPSVIHFVQLYKTPIPSLLRAALQMSSTSFSLVVPLAVIGVTLLTITALPRSSPAVVLISRRLLKALALAVACFSIYLLSCGGIVYRLVAQDQFAAITFYKRTLDQFALLEAAEGRYEKLRERVRQGDSFKVIPVGSVSEFSDDEARERVTEMLNALRETQNPATKRCILV